MAVLSVLPFAFFDLWYFMRGALVLLVASFDTPVKDILRDQTVRGKEDRSPGSPAAGVQRLGLGSLSFILNRPWSCGHLED